MKTSLSSIHAFLEAFQSKLQTTGHLNPKHINKQKLEFNIYLWSDSLFLSLLSSLSPFLYSFHPSVLSSCVQKRCMSLGHGPGLRTVPAQRRSPSLGGMLRNRQGCRDGIRRHQFTIFQARETFLQGVMLELGFQNKEKFSRRTRG